MNFTLLGALRSIERHRRRSGFYRSWETSLRKQQDLTLALSQMDPPEGADLVAARDALVEGVARGRPVGVIAKLRPDLFPALDHALLATGEGYGALADAARVLSEYHLREYTRLARVRGWLTGPLIAWIVASFVVPFPLMWDVSTRAYSGAIIGSVAALYLLGGIPASLLYSVAQSANFIRRPRFAWVLVMGLEVGLTFAAAARLAATTSGLTQVDRHIEGIPAKALKTMSLTAMLEDSGVWPEMLAQVRRADAASEYLSTLRIFAEHLESPP